MQHNILKANTDIDIQFYDCDPLGIVWHGNYVKYFEVGREAFCKAFHLNFLDIFHKHGFSTPLVNMDFSFKRPLTYKDVAVVEATFKKSDSAKLIFHYRIKKQATGELICTGSTTQVFVGKDNGLLSLTAPDFYLDWQKQNGLL
jgi:acyl-CoA thioester hydrolase